MVRPEKRIRTDEDLETFLSSRTFAELWAFMLRLNKAVLGKKRSALRRNDASAAVKMTAELLEKVNGWVESIERLDRTPGRFGNKAFRIWHGRLNAEAADLMIPIIESAAEDTYLKQSGVSLLEVADELGEYLATSFGNETRLDYGSGHEAHFLVLLFCLWRIGVFTEEDDEQLVLFVFPAYLEVTRALQTKYTLEPAGSHGVWGLDDYSFLPFLWGSAQLVGRNSLRVSPTDVLKEQIMTDNREEYLYVDAIATITAVKKGPFFEHSPMLYDISQVKAGWPKINQGMIKMYKAEVWRKRQAVQHILFGDVFPFAQRGEEEEEQPPDLPSPESRAETEL